MLKSDTQRSLWRHCYLMPHLVILLKHCVYDCSRSKCISVWTKAECCTRSVASGAQIHPRHHHAHTWTGWWLASPNFKTLSYDMRMPTSGGWFEDWTPSGRRSTQHMYPARGPYSVNTSWYERITVSAEGPPRKFVSSRLAPYHSAEGGISLHLKQVRQGARRDRPAAK